MTGSLLAALLATTLAILFIVTDDTADLGSEIQNVVRTQHTLSDSIRTMNAEVAKLLEDISKAKEHHQVANTANSKVLKAVTEFESGEAERIRAETKKKIDELHDLIEASKKDMIDAIKRKANSGV